jgi:hypothetical protein
MSKIKEDEPRPFEIQPLNDDVLGSLSIEALEERLEMQLLHVSEAQWCLIEVCGTKGCDQLECVGQLQPCDINGVDDPGGGGVYV